MQPIKNPDRQSAELARGIVEGIRFRVRASGVHLMEWVVLDVRDADGDLHELRLSPQIFTDLGGITKLGELRGTEVAGAAVRYDSFGAPGGPLTVSREMIWILAGPHAGRLLEAYAKTSSSGRTAVAVRDGHAAVGRDGRVPYAEPANRDATASDPVTE